MPASENKVAIYLLRDTQGTPRYVGKANNPEARLKGHIRDARRRRTPLYDWIRTLEGMPVLEVLEWCDAAHWIEREKFWIAEFRAKGKMLNLADGGDQPKSDRKTNQANARAMNQVFSADPWRRDLRRRVAIIARGLKEGFVSEPVRERMRGAVLRHPELLGSLRKYLWPAGKVA